jgi:hypothetical protein
MKLIIMFVTLLILCVSCGIKDDPKYQSKSYYNYKIKIV